MNFKCKKIFTLSLLFVLCLGIFISSASAFVPTAGQAGLDPNTGTGLTLTVIALPSVTGTQLANRFGMLHFVLSYDVTKLDYVSTARLPSISTWTGVTTPYSATNDADEGFLTVYAEAGLGQTLILGPPNAAALPTSLFTITFRAKSGASGRTTVSITEARISKTSGSDNGITDFDHPSTITISAAPPPPPPPPPPNPCAGVSCPDDCRGTTRRTGGSCSEGECTYATITENSANCGAPLTKQQRFADAITAIPANDVPATWTALFISRIAGILRSIFG